ncbi:MAG: 4-(cytidine 5'-diphospho)-2-C-methyl-D-erythritol kinase, partial [Pseudomonadota bacterium]
LPVAAGIGGGSADAAAALRLLARLWRTEAPHRIALSLGADVPVCLGSTPQRMEGIGERLTPLPTLPRAHIVLVNPLVGVPTGAVFAGLHTKANPPAGPIPKLQGFADLVGWLARQRNDLEGPARALCPPLGEVLEALAPAPLARMSGSGATCFALLPTGAAADRLAEDIRRQRPGWWVAAAPL